MLTLHPTNDLFNFIVFVYLLGSIYPLSFSLPVTLQMGAGQECIIPDDLPGIDSDKFPTLFALYDGYQSLTDSVS